MSLATISPPADRSAEPAPDRHERGRMFERLATLPPASREHQALREQLVRSHLPLALYFARRYDNRGEPFDDLAQAASLGLVKAVDRFDPERGVEFSTFAGRTILGELRRHFRDRTWAVHVHRSLQERSSLVGRCIREMTQELGRSPTVPELAERATLTDEQVVEAVECLGAYRATSMEATWGEDRTLGDVLGGTDPGFDRVDLHEALGVLLGRLPERERRILQLRFFGNLTQSQIAGQLGISQMHVSRLLARTLARLRRELDTA